MRRFVLTTAALVAAVFFWIAITLPPSPAKTGGEVDRELQARTVAGAFHVHSTGSDGVGTVDEIAASATGAGLRFVILTDHGDATRPPAPATYHAGVLIIDAVEISTNGGHYVALELGPAPYPLGGESSAVVEDVRRLGGFGIVAHPDSPRPELRWRDWTPTVDGVEWINLDSEWRDESRPRLARAAVDYMFRPGPAVASVLDRPTTLDRWDAVSVRRALIGVPGHDAHGGTREGERATGFRSLLRVPSYEASFRAFSLRAILERELTGDAETDARLVLAAVRSGQVFSSVDAIAGPSFLDFHGRIGPAVLMMGQTTEYAAGTVLSVRATTPAGGRLVLLQNGVEAASSVGPIEFAVDRPGVYRAEVHAVSSPGAPPVPWIVSNPIVITGAASAVVPAGEPVVVEALRAVGEVEKDAASTATIAFADGRRVFDFALRGGERASQYAALAISVPPGVSQFDQIAFTGRASAPMRVSVQLRFDSMGGARWTRSVYLSQAPERVVVNVADLVAAEGESALPSPTDARSLLFVVDLTNARPGQSGRFEISDLALAKSR